MGTVNAAAVKKEQRSVTTTETVFSVDVPGGTAEARVTSEAVTIFVQLPDGSRSDALIERSHFAVVGQLVQAIAAGA